MNILVTGGAGYIGSHTCIELINSGFNPIIIDNFQNSKEDIISKMQEFTRKNINYFNSDLKDKELIKKIILDFNCESIIHFAGLKSVGESQKNPLNYYSNNISGTINLLEAMKETKIKKIVFSSSASVYGDPLFLPITENHPLRPKSVYGKTKLIIENILRDIYSAHNDWSICILRYFNPIGAHSSGILGEEVKDSSSNLLPLVSQVASGRRNKVDIWGNNYKTIDGTGVRDFIHIEDLAKGHVKAIQILEKPQCIELNLGTGKGQVSLDL